MKGSINKNVMVLGGYGAAGRAICKNLLKYSESNLFVCGRNAQKTDDFVSSLKISFPGREINATNADANDKNSLLAILEPIDLLIVTTTTPDSIEIIAEAALSTKTDMLDIFVRGDMVKKLSNYQDRIIDNEIIFITQAGFHPGLITPIILAPRSLFDNYQEANVFMAMELIVETPESVHEIIYEVIEGNSKVLKNGEWVKASYTDALKKQFSGFKGIKNCYPLEMREMRNLNKDPGLKSAGAYAAGFNTFIDFFVFSLALIIGFFNKNLSQKISGKLIFWNIRKRRHLPPRVEIILEAKGQKDGRLIKYIQTIKSEDGYDITALAVVACLYQYFDNTISKPGLYLMGEIVDAKRIITDLEKMGVWMNDQIIADNIPVT